MKKNFTFLKPKQRENNLGYLRQLVHDQELQIAALKKQSEVAAKELSRTVDAIMISCALTFGEKTKTGYELSFPVPDVNAPYSVHGEKKEDGKTYTIIVVEKPVEKKNEKRIEKERTKEKEQETKKKEKN